MRRVISWCIWMGLVFSGFGQVNDPDSTSISAYKDQVRQLISFLQFNFNTIGDPLTTAREKEIIINQSFDKIFESPDVQIEDDLAVYRSTVINKDVQAYLKDIDFFFKEVSFEFIVQDISHEVNETGNLYFKVSMDRLMKGINVDGDTINDLKQRFVEVNLDAESRVLKIASIYTTKLSEREDLTRWWNGLSYDWKQFFAGDISVTDSLKMTDLLAVSDSVGVGDTLVMESGDTINVTGTSVFGDLKRILQSRRLDLSDNPSLTDLTPVSKLTQLKELDISGTILSDLIPIRNLTHLEVLYCQNTRIDDLSPIKYAVSLRELNCANTRITSLEVLKDFPELTKLNVSQTFVEDLSPLTSLNKLKELLINETWVSDLNPLKNLKALETFNCSKTRVNSIQPLKGIQSLQNLYIENTEVASLQPLIESKGLRLLFADGSYINNLTPLKGLPEIKKIYCDTTKVSAGHANQFMRQKPSCLVIYNSESLSKWWTSLPKVWKTKFKELVVISEKPTREELHQIAGITRVDLNTNKEITSLEPLQTLTNLEYLFCAHTPIKDLSPISDLVQLKSLDLSHTNIKDLTALKYLSSLKDLNVSFTAVDTINPLSGLSNLEYLDLDGTGIDDLTALYRLEKLKNLYCDSTKVSEADVKGFYKKRPQCLVVFQTSELEGWWKNLSEPWKKVIQGHSKLDVEPSREQLHQAIVLKAISISDNLKINNLVPLKKFLNLNFLKINNTRVSDLSPIAYLTSLEAVDCSQNPISSLEALRNLNSLNYVNCENTPISSLEPISGSFKLVELACSGTQIRDLNALENLKSLKQLDFSNTGIRKLKPLEALPNLTVLKCFNTRLNEKKVDVFRAKKPNCEVVFY